MRADVWIVKRKRKRRATFAVRWVDPASGKMRCETAGADRKLAQAQARKKRDELAAGIIGDPIDVKWAAFVDAQVERVRMQKSAKYADDVCRVLGQFAMTCTPAGPLRVNYEMFQRFINTRLRGAKMCPRRSCKWSIGLDRTKCWRCEADLTGAKQRPCNGTTVNKDLRTLKACFSDAMKRYSLRRHPMTGVAMVEAHEKPINTLAPDDQHRVLAAAPDLRWRALLYLAVTTGMRRGELCRLEWDDIDLDARRLIVRYTKGKRPRTVRFTDAAVDMLRQLRLTHAHPLVFVGDNGTDFYRQVDRGLARIIQSAGVKAFRFHDLRRTCATDMARAGVNQRVAQVTLGHAAAATTARYYQAIDDDMQDAAIQLPPLAKGVAS